MLQQQKSKLQCPQNKEQIAVDLLASTECPRHSSDKPLLCILIREAQKRHRKTWGARFEDRIAEDCFYTRSLGKHSLLDLPRQAFQRALRAFEATLLEIGVGRLSESRCWRRFCLMRAAEQSMTGVYKRWGSLESVLVAIVDAMKYWRHLETSGDIWRPRQAKSFRRTRPGLGKKPSPFGGVGGHPKSAKASCVKLTLLRYAACLASLSRVNLSIH